MVVLEKAGKPTVSIISAGFERDAMVSAQAFGLPQFRYALVPEVLTGQSPERIGQHVTDAFEQIVGVLTTNVDGGGDGNPVALETKPAEVMRIEGADKYDAFEAMNRQFLDDEWGDGFPLIPPTPEKVEWMLKGTTRRPEDMVTVLPPGMGLATVEKIAINGVMAGCEPAHLPILMAASEALPGFGTTARALTMSTSPNAPLMVINGPIAGEIGINSGRCALGPGAQSRHNVVLGRAFRLILMNVGNAYPGRMDMDTIGSARKFSLCVAENEAESPWGPYHVDQGFDKDESTVTLFDSIGEGDVDDLTNYEPERVLDSFAAICSNVAARYVINFFDQEKPTDRLLLAMCPEHANICGKAGWSKYSVREYVHNNARMNARVAMSWGRMTPEIFRPQWKWLLERSEWELEQLTLNVMESSDFYDIVVLGGPAGKSLVFNGICGCPSTVAIKDRAEM